MDIREYIKHNLLIFDGAMGTMLQTMGLKVGELPEELNFTEENTIIEIHKKYIAVGANIITSNTFGANEIKLQSSKYSVEEVISKALENALEAKGEKEIYVALDMGPIGQLMEPLGTLGFQRAYDMFKRQAIQGEKSGADVILIETMSDLYEAKAAILAAKENTKLPVFCTMSFQKDRRTFTGVSALAMVMTLQGLGADALGVNCSLGPKELNSIIDEMLNYATVPVIVQPNAGLPKVVDNKTLYDLSDEEFALAQLSNVEKGVRIVGGCCGTTDSYIRKMAEKIKYCSPKSITPKAIFGVCSSSKVVFIDGVKVIGERINPTGKKLFKEALRNGDMDYILREAIEQIECGAHILDVNVGLPEINEEEVIAKVIKEIQAITDVPLQVDTNNPKAIEKALRVYNGKAIVNSVNGEEEVLDEVLPLVKKYGAAVVGLTLDKRGIPASAEERVEIAEKILNKALSYGIKKEDVYIDTLTLTAASNQKEVMETLKALTLVKKKLGVKTLLGVSNVSFGLPSRNMINKVFLAMALQAGLDLPIINPKDEEIMETIAVFNVLNNMDISATKFISRYGEGKKGSSNKTNILKELDLKDIIIKGLKDEAKEATIKALKSKKSQEIIEEDLITALDKVGAKFERGEIFLPQMIQSAETVKNAFEVIKHHMTSSKENETIYKGTIIMATVKGDIHDIGKNIVRLILENYGYWIIDLGKDVEPEIIVEAIKKYNVKLVGLSALMTTTVKSMEETIKLIQKNNLDCKVFVGGAVLNQEYADNIKADYYAKDAKEAVEIARRVLG